MVINTKFDLNQNVTIIKKNIENEYIPCDLCKGRGVVKIEGAQREVICPECHGVKGLNHFKGYKWVIDFSDKPVGRYKYEVVYDKEEGKERVLEEYYSIGDYHCQLYPAEDVFATIREAQEECIRRNNDLKCKNDGE